MHFCVYAVSLLQQVEHTHTVFKVNTTRREERQLREYAW
jgi:hypothetical protein